MANLDFVSYPLGEYTMNNIKFGEGVKNTPKVFSNNYFMRNKDGNFMTSKLAKKYGCTGRKAVSTVSMKAMTPPPERSRCTRTSRNSSRNT